jgi:hypothetical protein
MAQKKSIKEENIILPINYLRQDLKKLFLLIGLLILVVIILAVIDRQTNFLTRLASLLMTKIVGQ